MATKIVDNRPKPVIKLFDELNNGEVFLCENSHILKIKTYDVTDDTGEILTNTVDLDDGIASYTPISERVIPVNVTITIES